MITHAYLDLDPIAYVGASICEKSAYQWVKNDGSEKSEVFSKAYDAKIWLEGVTEFDGESPDDWTRDKIKVLLPFEDAVKALEGEMKKWLTDIKKLTKNDDIILKGWLTSSGRKDKDIDGLENRYQYNRYLKEKDPENPVWEREPKLLLLAQCREYILTNFDWAGMSPPGVEADALVVGFAERKGDKAVVCCEDKDLRQVMNSHFIDMNDQPGYRKLEFVDTMGYCRIKRSLKDSPSLEGAGFLLIAAQTIGGDQTDGYKGVHGMGCVKVVKMLEKALTPKDACFILKTYYEEKFKNGHEYVDWNGQSQKRTWQELLIQHMQLAYHERGSKDTSNPIARFLDGEQILY